MATSVSMSTPHVIAATGDPSSCDFSGRKARVTRDVEIGEVIAVLTTRPWLNTALFPDPAMLPVLLSAMCPSVLNVDAGQRTVPAPENVTPATHVLTDSAQSAVNLWLSGATPVINHAGFLPRYATGARMCAFTAPAVGTAQDLGTEMAIETDGDVAVDTVGIRQPAATMCPQSVSIAYASMGPDGKASANCIVAGLIKSGPGVDDGTTVPLADIVVIATKRISKGHYLCRMPLAFHQEDADQTGMALLDAFVAAHSTLYAPYYGAPFPFCDARWAPDAASRTPAMWRTFTRNVSEAVAHNVLSEEVYASGYGDARVALPLAQFLFTSQTGKPVDLETFPADTYAMIKTSKLPAIDAAVARITAKTLTAEQTQELAKPGTEHTPVPSHSDTETLLKRRPALCVVTEKLVLDITCAFARALGIVEVTPEVAAALVSVEVDTPTDPSTGVEEHKECDMDVAVSSGTPVRPGMYLAHTDCLPLAGFDSAVDAISAVAADSRSTFIPLGVLPIAA